MVAFSFNFNIIKNKSKTNNIKNKVLVTDVEGIINVELNGLFYITDLKDNKFEIYPTNYNCKGKAKIYPLLLDKKTHSRICYIRNENRQELLHTAYLPFSPGPCVKGNIIEEHNNKYFDIKDIYINNNIKNVKKAFEFYRNNYKEIIRNIKKK